MLDFCLPPARKYCLQTSKIEHCFAPNTHQFPPRSTSTSHCSPANPRQKQYDHPDINLLFHSGPFPQNSSLAITTSAGVLLGPSSHSSDALPRELNVTRIVLQAGDSEYRDALFVFSYRASSQSFSPGVLLLSRV
ncbi:hypothetical protein L484_003468 [Morus notabilis]|uniref:Uncharacterized protein n=1 Tax=Morus notabilis TaxID=981085 RepID=W9QNM6_9ROSA|nr:hypothetical protein L484_003468 [Morus notabilis]